MRPGCHGVAARVGLIAPILIAAIGLVGDWTPANGQEAAPAGIALVGATIHTGTDQGIVEGGVVLLRGGKIEAVGAADLAIPEGFTTVDVSGLVITPGLIDARSVLLTGDREGNSADLQIAEDLDPFDDHIDDALAQGVTAVHAGPSANKGLAGRGAVIKLGHGPGDLETAIVRRHASVEGAFGATNGVREDPTERHDELEDLVKLLKKVPDYQEKWEKYRKRLAAYEKAVAEAGDSGDAEDSGDTEDAGDADEDEASDEEGDAEGDVDEKDEEGDGEGEKEKEEEETKKPERPKEPTKDPKIEALVAVVAGELPLRLVVHRSDDIRVLATLLDDFENVKIVLDGATEAYRVAADLTRWKFGLVLEPPSPDALDRLEYVHHQPSAFQLLLDAGLAPAIGSWGKKGADTRWLRLHAAEAVRAGASPVDALAAITTNAAAVLGVDDRMGSLAAGKDADLVVFDGPPLAATSRVVAVYVDGARVHPAPGAESE